MAALIATIVLFTAVSVYTRYYGSPIYAVKVQRNLAVIAAYVMLHSNCTDVGYYLSKVNSTQPLPGQTTSWVVTWCNGTPVVRGFSWSP
ncbi:hypothetical protein Tpen_0675 [Thermofilum pendens Hrk 5]|uniref:Uncharacterized protein n=1 Tax=Thermofilum pendens (strain DSM 2475 / Hrk 5) TaxID=368408 RepID=A1RXZ7_THEPD|nr:hypothetical protein Tpen_0675 [Thermofilum pendens Hrk 5]